MGFKKRREKTDPRADKLRTQLAVERMEHRAQLRRLRTSLRKIQNASALLALELGDPGAKPELKRNKRSRQGGNDTETAVSVAKRVALHSELTGQQTAVLLLFVRNLSKDEVAEALGISLETMKSHISGILRRTEDARLADLLRRIHRTADGSS